MLYTNKSAEFFENRNKSASVYVPPEQIREAERICFDRYNATYEAN